MKLFRFAKKSHALHVYQMSTDEDYFYIHPNSVLLGFLAAVAVILLFLLLAGWIGYDIW